MAKKKAPSFNVENESARLPLVEDVVEKNGYPENTHVFLIDSLLNTFHWDRYEEEDTYEVVFQDLLLFTTNKFGQNYTKWGNRNDIQEVLRQKYTDEAEIVALERAFLLHALDTDLQFPRSEELLPTTLEQKLLLDYIERYIQPAVARPTNIVPFDTAQNG